MYRDSGTYVVQGTGVSSPRDDTLVRKDNTCSDSSASSMFIDMLIQLSFSVRWVYFCRLSFFFHLGNSRFTALPNGSGLCGCEIGIA